MEIGVKLDNFVIWLNIELIFHTIIVHILNSRLQIYNAILPSRTVQMMPSCLMFFLTHCGLMTPFGDRDQGQHSLRQWLVAWRHQAITWTDVDWSSVKSSDIHIRANPQEMPQPPISTIRLKFVYLKFHSNIPGANELIYGGTCWLILITVFISQAAIQ